MLRHAPIRRRGRPELKALDSLCRKVVFARDGYMCIRCAATARLQWCHVYSRRYRSLRWSLLNGMTLCAGCHLWWHHRPLEAAAWWARKVGPRVASQLEIAARMRAGTTRKIDPAAVRLHLEQALAHYGVAP